MELHNEEWKDIVESDGLYQISNMGRVRSLLDSANTKILIPQAYGCGYLKVSMRINGRRKQLGVHRLVAEAFLPNPNNLPEVNHINCVKTDNRVCNLEWVSHRDNCLKRDNSNIFVGRRRKPVCQYTIDGQFVREWASAGEASSQMGISRGVIYFCCQGRYKTAHGYKWQYKNGGNGNG